MARGREEAGSGHARRLLLGSQVTGPESALITRETASNSSGLVPAVTVSHAETLSSGKIGCLRCRRHFCSTQCRDQGITTPSPKLSSTGLGLCFVSACCVEKPLNKVRFKLLANCSVAVKSERHGNLSVPVMFLEAI